MFEIGDRVMVVGSGPFSGEIGEVVAVCGTDYRVRVSRGTTVLVGCRGLIHTYQGVETRRRLRA